MRASPLTPASSAVVVGEVGELAVTCASPDAWLSESCVFRHSYGVRVGFCIAVGRNAHRVVLSGRNDSTLVLRQA